MMIGSNEVSRIIGTIPDLKDKIALSQYILMLEHKLYKPKVIKINEYIDDSDDVKMSPQKLDEINACFDAMDAIDNIDTTGDPILVTQNGLWKTAVMHLQDDLEEEAHVLVYELVSMLGAIKDSGEMNTMFDILDQFVPEDRDPVIVDGFIVAPPQSGDQHYGSLPHGC